MGRWTLKHTDDVLVTKIENIINGVIRRSKEEADEKTKPLMSYESFVESLDEEDAFVTTLFDILFKELADRRTRPTQEDRKLIAHRTSENLHSLAVTSGTYPGAQYSNRIYRAPRVFRPRPPASLYTPNDSLDEDEDDFGMADGMGAMEGARIDSALYDVYNPGPTSNPRPPYPFAPTASSAVRADDSSAAFRPYEVPSIPGRQLPIPHNHFGVPMAPRRWSSVFGSAADRGTSHSPTATSLTRQPSIHRGRRVRLPTTSTATPSAEFSEFAARRRSSHRQLVHQYVPVHHPDGSVTLPERSPPPTNMSTSNLPRATLFDPPSPTARDAGTRVSSPSSSAGGVDDAETGRRARGGPEPRPSSLLVNSRDGEDSNSNNNLRASGDIIADWRTLPPVPGAPRIPLRRGGIQAPETMLPSADSILPPDADVDADMAFSLPPILHPPEDGHVSERERNRERDRDALDALRRVERELRASVEFDPWSGINIAGGVNADGADRMFLDRNDGGESVAPPPPPATASLPTPRSESPSEGEEPRSTTNVTNARSLSLSPGNLNGFPTS